jgi:small subunit ribosomal protein S9
MVEVVKYAGTGRRKSSVARVVLTPGEGNISVNKRQFNDYFPRETDRLTIMTPLKLTNLEKKFDVAVRVTGGGATGQAGAFKLGLSRALISCDPLTRAVLKKAGCLTRDDRMKERKKPGQKGTRRKFQWVKR